MSTASEDNGHHGFKTWNVSALLGLPGPEHEWIVEGLIRPGSQVLLAAPPKSGKSLLASEIALALAVPLVKGEQRYLFRAEQRDNFPGLRIFPPVTSATKAKGEDRGWKVLFFSLEMREAEVAARLRRQLVQFVEKVDPTAPCIRTIDLIHVFGGNGPEKELIQDLRIIGDMDGHSSTGLEGRDFQRLRDFIMKEKPDVVIYDTLIQLHNADENDNMQMKSVMRTLRQITVRSVEDKDKISRMEPIAHIVLHHTRKESAQYRSALSPDIMRGAGSVHGAADLVMLARPDYRREALEIHISSRSSSVPNFFLLRDKNTLTHKAEPRASQRRLSNSERIKKVILDMLSGSSGRMITKSQLESAVAKVRRKSEGQADGELKVPQSDVTIQRYFDQLCGARLIKKRKRKQKRVRTNAVDHWYQNIYVLNSKKAGPRRGGQKK